MKLTKPWKEVHPNTTYLARLGNILLRCDYYLGSRRWEGKVIASFGDRSCFRHREKSRKSFKLAMKDTEKLARELQQDIIEGARQIMNRYGMSD